ncbi:hypothetical protein CFC21_111901 [Triticum aestivum]|uniref:Exostosin GT47 domain-containing protein n=2 Tax=Triticum aestivum TaxID=4565 RepID=A0A3B6TSR1_WHEAT|nr:xyloglucan galactosyltransferase KATAMARI1 homolog [Triticum aestivum]KAF7111948.1 hypothetical protein CFC21_111901 [Triticum aestivum]
MEARSCRNKFILYGLLFIGSWLLSCLLHFQFLHIPILSYTYKPSSSHHGAAAGPTTSLLLSPQPAVVEHRSCNERRVFMLHLPSRFNLLRGCLEGSPEFEDACIVMSNAGLGPELVPLSSNHTNGVIPNGGWFNTNHHALEVMFHTRMWRYECLTDNPAAATAVYVPYYPGLELNHYTCDTSAMVRDGPSGEFLRWLSSQPRWATLGGRDHFMVASKTTWMFRRSGGDDSQGCGNGFLNRPECLNMTVLTIESNIWERRDMAVPYPTYFHPSSSSEVAAWQARARGAHRPWLFAFAGGRRPNGTLVLRDRVIDQCESSSRCGMLDCSHGLEGSITCQSPEKLMYLFVSSQFCLQPYGDSFMRRSSIDAVVAGCIPVFFHEASTFEKQYRWHEPDRGRDGVHRSYSVFIDNDHVLEGKVDIEEVLSRFTDEEVAAMREEVIKMIPRFVYTDPRVRFEGDMRDGFDIAIDEVMARMMRIENGEDLGW